MGRPRRLTRSPQEARRVEAGRRLQAGPLSSADIARRRGVRRMALSQGARPLHPHPGAMPSWHPRLMPGRPARLSAEQWQRVPAALPPGARRAGCDPERWTLRRTRAVRRAALGVRSHAHAPARRLQARGWRPPQPALCARAREDALGRAWLRHAGPRLNQRRAARRRPEWLWVQPAFQAAPGRGPRGLRSGRARSRDASASAGPSPRGVAAPAPAVSTSATVRMRPGGMTWCSPPALSSPLAPAGSS
jgi:hypothetical protein